MKIDNELILKLEKLTKLKLDPKDKDALKLDLEKVIEMFDKILNAPTTGIEPMRHFVDIETQLRSDIPDEPDYSRSLLKLSKDSKDAYFTVPKVIEQ